MGSLPNLSDLGKDDYNDPVYKLGSVIGQSNCVGHQGILTQEEKNKILHRHSGYNKNTNKIKRHPQPSNIDDLILEVSNYTRLHCFVDLIYSIPSAANGDVFSNLQ